MVLFYAQGVASFSFEPIKIDGHRCSPFPGISFQDVLPDLIITAANHRRSTSQSVARQQAKARAIHCRSGVGRHPDSGLESLPQL